MSNDKHSLRQSNQQTTAADIIGAKQAFCVYKTSDKAYLFADYQDQHSVPRWTENVQAAYAAPTPRAAAIIIKDLASRGHDGLRIARVTLSISLLPQPKTDND